MVKLNYTYIIQWLYKLYCLTWMLNIQLYIYDNLISRKNNILDDVENIEKFASYDDDFYLLDILLCL